MGDITSANAVLTISIAGIFPIPQTLIGFATDDIYSIPAVQNTETAMGVDGVLSGGFVFKEYEQEIALQADSLSCAIFDIWNLTQKATKSVFPCTGIIILPAIGKKFIQTTGYLTQYKAAPDGKRTLQPVRHRITWGDISPAPA